MVSTNVKSLKSSGHLKDEKKKIKTFPIDPDIAIFFVEGLEVIMKCYDLISDVLVLTIMLESGGSEATIMSIILAQTLIVNSYVGYKIYNQLKK